MTNLFFSCLDFAIVAYCFFYCLYLKIKPEQVVTTYTHHSDEEILSLIRKNDDRAFIEVYNRYAGKLRALAYSKVNSKEITEEIIQDIFLDVWERRSSVEIKNLSVYLFTAVKYQAINHIKKRIHFEKYSNACIALETISEEETLESVKYNDLVSALEKGVLKLPEKSQQVFRLNRIEGKTVEEIARKLNLSQKAIEYHIYKSVKELRLHLKDFIAILIASLYL